MLERSGRQSRLHSRKTSRLRTSYFRPDPMSPSPMRVAMRSRVPFWDNVSEVKKHLLTLSLNNFIEQISKWGRLKLLEIIRPVPSDELGSANPPADQNVAGTACQLPAVGTSDARDSGISDKVKVTTNNIDSPPMTPTRRSKPGLIESGGPWPCTMLIR